MCPDLKKQQLHFLKQNSTIMYHLRNFDTVLPLRVHPPGWLDVRTGNTEYIKLMIVIFLLLASVHHEINH